MLSDIVWNRTDTDREQKIYEEKNINAYTWVSLVIYEKHPEEKLG